MKLKTLNLLACPIHRDANLTLTDARWEGKEIIFGTLVCERCDRHYPMSCGIPSFVKDFDIPNAAKIRFRDKTSDQFIDQPLDQILHYYHKHHDIESALYRRHKLIPSSPRSTTILDIGVGWGVVWREMTDLHHIIGIDFSISSLKILQRLYRELETRLEPIHGSLSVLPFKLGVFDMVWSTQVCQHIKEPREITKSFWHISQILKKDGVFICEDLNLHELYWETKRPHLTVLRFLRKVTHASKAPESRVDADKSYYFLRRYSPSGYTKLFNQSFAEVRVRASEVFWRSGGSGLTKIRNGHLDWLLGNLPFSLFISRQLTAVSSGLIADVKIQRSRASICRLFRVLECLVIVN